MAQNIYHDHNETSWLSESSGSQWSSGLLWSLWLWWVGSQLSFWFIVWDVNYKQNLHDNSQMKCHFNNEHNDIHQHYDKP